MTLSLSHWYLGLGVVLDCIDSWSLPSFLLCMNFSMTFLCPNLKDYKNISLFNRKIHPKDRERSRSVVECLTPDRRAMGSSHTGVTALCP